MARAFVIILSLSLEEEQVEWFIKKGPCHYPNDIAIRCWMCPEPVVQQFNTQGTELGVAGITDSDRGTSCY
jgi:hypothetical protein